MKTYHHVWCLFIALLLASNISMGDKPSCPSDVNLLLDMAQRGSTTTVTVQCSVYVAVKECQIKWELRDEKEAILENTMLWEGMSSTKFSKQFSRSITIPEGGKSIIHVTVIYSEPDGEKCGSGANLYIYHDSIKGMLYDPGSFYDLKKRELWKEVQAKGLKWSDLNEIRSRDPELAKKIEGLEGTATLGPGSATPRPAPPTLQQVQEQNKRPVSNLTHEDSVKMQQAIRNSWGDGNKQPPRYDTIDTLGIRMRKEARRKR